MVWVGPAYSISSGVGAGAGSGLRAAAGGRAAVGSSRCSGGCGCFAGAGGFAGALACGFAWGSATLSPLAAISAIGVLTATCSVPSGITILASTPSSTASTSIVALSVSISVSTSPARTSSPSLLTQRAILPSVIVGDSAGISTSLAMSPPALGAQPHPPHHSPATCLSHRQHIGPQFGGIRLRAILRKLRRLGDELAHLALRVLQFVLGCVVRVEQPLPQIVDRIMLGPQPIDLVLAAVLRRR